MRVAENWQSNASDQALIKTLVYIHLRAQQIRTVDIHCYSISYFTNVAVALK